MSLGPATLTDADLLAIVLGAGIKGRDVLRVAGDVLEAIDSSWPQLEHDSLTAIPGVGPAKAKLIVAALEFARRRLCATGGRITKATDVMPSLLHYANKKQEHFLCVSLNGAHEVITTRVITIGLVNSTQVHPREVFSDPICDRACAIIVAHNHPSGNTSPSDQDYRTTRMLREAGEILGIKLLDHIIFSRSGYFSFAEEKVL